MNFKKIFTFFLLMLIVFLGFNIITKASNIFTKFEILEMKNGTVKLKWNTSLGVKGDIYYGTDANNLDRYMGYSLFDRFHQTSLTGIESDKDYYYKINAEDSNGNIYKSTIQTFSTDDMIDNRAPKFEEDNIVQYIHSAVAIQWKTDEETKAKIYYGENEDILSKSTTYKSYRKDHLKFITKLKKGTLYYIKLIAIDRDGNQAIKRMNFRTSSTEKSLEVKNLEPNSFDSDKLDKRSATISFDSSWMARSIIYYGTSPKKIKKKVYINKDYPVLEHEITLENLQPDTLYYYKIKLYKSYRNAGHTTGVKTFKTKALGDGLKTGDLVKSTNNKVYVIKGTQKAWIEDEETFKRLKFNWNWIKVVDDELLNDYTEITKLSKKSKHPDGTLFRYEDDSAVYMIDGGKKRPFFTGRAFERRGLGWDKVITVPNSKSWKYSTGDNLY